MRSYRKFDVGICIVTDQKKKWNEGCKDGFKLKGMIGGRPYIVCENCINWDGKTNFEQSRLDDKNTIKEIIQSRHEVIL